MCGSYGYDGNGKRVKKSESGTTGAKRVIGGWQSVVGI